MTGYEPKRQALIGMSRKSDQPKAPSSEVFVGNPSSIKKSPRLK
jgi:hypothetical protein